ncbi:hypothetical protein AVEN_198950-1 [Araneus ventricosus]|uniref:Uncharacterized protein n=1 Tax=Araneus ventricosus TaxID=182803 RepID=A0A4Y2P6V8_ARAVE|nr:hypothetical protein AVEN_198950-1 [Araneus ventricosus]
MQKSHKHPSGQWESVWNLQPSQTRVLKTRFGASVSDLPYLSTSMGGGKNGPLFGQNGIALTSRECPALEVIKLRFEKSLRSYKSTDTNLRCSLNFELVRFAIHRR